MFSLGAPAVASSSGSTGTINAVYDPTPSTPPMPANFPGNLQASDYRLDYNGAAYSMTRLSDNAVIALPGFPGTPANVDGMLITEASAPTGVSSFLIRPTFDAASYIKTLITDPKQVAAAGTTGGSGSPIPGDNTAALKFAALENTAVFGGTVSLNTAYGALVSNVATLTQSGQNSSAAQQTLLNSIKQTQANLAGVNLDEEAANLIKFQNAYQASAKAVTIANSLFDTLIGAIR